MASRPLPSRPRVLITSGDPGGVGPELVLRALADPGISGLAEFTAVGDPADFERAAAALALPLPRIHPAPGRAAAGRRPGRRARPGAGRTALGGRGTRRRVGGPRGGPAGGRRGR